MPRLMRGDSAELIDGCGGGGVGGVIIAISILNHSNHP